MKSFVSKISSRKFLIAVAAFLGSLGGGITGLATGNEKLALCGGTLMVFSAAIYAACEAYVDGKSAAATNVSLSVEAKPTKIDDTERLLNTFIQNDSVSDQAKEGSSNEKADTVAKD